MAQLLIPKHTVKQQIWCLKLPIMFSLSLNCTLCLVRTCVIALLFKMMIDARVDIRISGFWMYLHHTFFDVRVFNWFAASNISSTLATVFRKHELEKHHAYEEYIQEVECGSFTPLFFLPQVAWEGLLPQHLAGLLSEKWSSYILWWWAGSVEVGGSPCCVLLRGSCSTSKYPCVPPAVDLAIAEGHLPAHWTQGML